MKKFPIVITIGALLLGASVAVAKDKEYKDSVPWCGTGKLNLNYEAGLLPNDKNGNKIRDDIELYIKAYNPPEDISHHLEYARVIQSALTATPEQYKAIDRELLNAEGCIAQSLENPQRAKTTINRIKFNTLNTKERITAFKTFEQGLKSRENLDSLNCSK